MRLQAEDLQASVDGAKAGIVNVVGPNDPLVLVVVLDLVGDLNKIDAARTKVAEYVTAMQPNQYAALLRAQDGLQVLLDPTRNRRQFVEKLEGAPVSGFPGLLDSVEQTAEIATSMLRGSRVRVAALYLTDGQIADYRGDYSSTVVNPSDSGDLSRRFRDRLVQEKIASIAANLGGSSAPLFFLHLEERTDSLNVAYQNGIRQFAAATGGQAYFSRGLADVPTLVQQALADIEATYIVAIEASEEWRGSERLQVLGPPGSNLTHRETLGSVKPRK